MRAGRDLVGPFIDAATSADAGDVIRAALLVARVEHRALDPQPTENAIARLGAVAARRIERLGAGAPPEEQVDTLNALLFEDEGFHGDTEHYDDPRNSFLNDVVARRTGIPITLAVIYLEVGRLAGVRLEGVNFPGHFLVRHAGTHAGESRRDLIIDPFHGGALLGEVDLRELLREHAGEEVAYSRHLMASADKRQILTRMLVNLKRLYVSMRSFPQARTVVELLTALDPLALAEVRDRGLLAYHEGDFSAALRDLEGYLRATSRTAASAGADEDRREEYQQVWEHVKTLRRRIASFN
jgi:regulator of sirC expression with transglutaminase-like and TPR domain